MSLYDALMATLVVVVVLAAFTGLAGFSPSLRFWNRAKQSDGRSGAEPDGSAADSGGGDSGGSGD